MTLGVPVSGVIAAAFLIFSVFCGWRGGRPSPLLGAPRMVPWRFLMLASAVVVLVSLVHIVAVIRGETT